MCKFPVSTAAQKPPWSKAARTPADCLGALLVVNNISQEWQIQSVYLRVPTFGVIPFEVLFMGRSRKVGGLIYRKGCTVVS